MLDTDRTSCSGMHVLIIINVLSYHLLALCENITLTNGWVTYDPTSYPRLERTTATHNCNGNSVLSGGSQRICQSNRTWSGDIITCKGELVGKNL